MSDGAPLSEVFAARLDDQRRAALPDVAELEAALVALLDAGRAAWPDLSLGGVEFAAYLADRVGDRLDRASLERLPAADLYLACGCLHHDEVAHRHFDGALTTAVATSVRRLRSTASEAADLLQLLREKLLWGDGEGPPRIADYAGRGELRGWLRVTAVRMAVSALRAQQREQARRDELAHAMPGSTGDPELDFLREQVREDFKIAFEQALTLLSGRERTLLRLSFFDDLSIDEIGAAFRVHRATAARWLAAARKHLLDETRRLLMERLGANPAEVESIVRMLDSQLHVSVQRFLEPAGAPRRRKDPR
jgi:RNA polymerase sigma-70 factor, ECF subfamily